MRFSRFMTVFALAGVGLLFGMGEALAGTFIERETTLMDRGLSVLGIPALLGITWLLSRDRKNISWRPVLWGIAIQIVLAVALLNPYVAGSLFDAIDVAVKTLLSFGEEGANFLFQGVEPHQVKVMVNDTWVDKTFVGQISPPVKTVAFWVLPSIIFFSSLMTLLYHLGIMQWVVNIFAWAMRKTMGTSGSESLSAAANIFVGQTEAPLLVKPFISTMTRSELNAVMVGGFATVAGGVMAIYVVFLRDIPGIAGHLATASVLSAPAALAVAKILVPETEVSKTAGGLKMSIERPDTNAVEAVARGATEGLKLAANVAAMLIAFIALVAMVDGFFGLFGLSFSEVLGWLFSPLAFVMGVPWEEAPVVGQLLGEKLVLTELIAYSHLQEMLQGATPVLSERSSVIASYALCGFANFASIGIQIGGIGGIAPERRKDLAEMSVLAMLGGTLAACLTGTIAGILL